MSGPPVVEHSLLPAMDADIARIYTEGEIRGLKPSFVAEWRATEAALAEIEAEIPYPLSRVAADLEQALERRSFHEQKLPRPDHRQAGRG